MWKWEKEKEKEEGEQQKTENWGAAARGAAAEEEGGRAAEEGGGREGGRAEGLPPGGNRATSGEGEKVEEMEPEAGMRKAREDAGPENAE